MKYLKWLTLIAILVFPFNLLAGWIITGRYIDREGNTIMKRYFIQSNMIKVEVYNLLYICDLKNENIILIDPENLVYTKTSLSAYRAKIKSIKLARLAELLLLIPEEQKTEYDRIYRSEVDQEIILPVIDDDSLIIRQLPDTSKLLGYKTLKFSIFENGLKKEEFFFTNDVNLSKDIDFATFLQYAFLIEPEDYTLKYLNSENYLATVKDGLVTRRFIFKDGFRSEWQVNKVEFKDIPAYEFGKPDLCKEVNLDKWLARKNNADEKYYDDYE